MPNAAETDGGEPLLSRRSSTSLSNNDINTDNDPSNIGDDNNDSLNVNNTNNETPWSSVKWGKTNDTIFKVPQTYDLLVNFFNNPQPYTLFETIPLIIAGLQVLVYLLLGATGILPRWWFLLTFLVWRVAYNGGLGWLLKWQSEKRGMVKMAKKMGFGCSTDREVQKGLRWWVAALRNEINNKMGPDYDYDKYPLEYNTWLLFRGLVDVVLLNDFVSYIIFAVAYFEWPVSVAANGVVTTQLGGFDLLRLVGGVFILCINVWVKIDALRVIGDYAWYWGDFFFLLNNSLTFDGIFLVVIHPMYTCGYIGFYGISLICSSYWVVFVSFFAHGLQIAFLLLIEEPHIKKTYGGDDQSQQRSYLQSDFLQNYFRRDLIVFKNFDFFRSTDTFSAFIVFYSVAVSFLINSYDSNELPWFFILQALFWRFIHTVVLGFVLHQQSQNKFFTKHFIKFGEGNKDAFGHWKAIYNLSQTMVYVSFLVLAVKVYQLPESIWGVGGSWLLRHTLGVLLIFLNVSTTISVFNVLGEYGWFYGDFFIDPYLFAEPNLRYEGIYRFINNPEKIIGHAAFYGIALICKSYLLFAIALFGQISNFIFLKLVEDKHMYKLYGDKVRSESGSVVGLKKVVERQVSQIALRLDDRMAKNRKVKDVLSEIRKLLDDRDLGEFIQVGRRKGRSRRGGSNDDDNASDRSSLLDDVSSASDSNMSSDEFADEPEPVVLVKAKEQQIPSKLSSENDSNSRPSSPSSFNLLKQKISATSRTFSPRGNQSASLQTIPVEKYDIQFTSVTTKPEDGKLEFMLGQPIRITWTASLHHVTKHDWIGVYSVMQNISKEMTSSSSQKKWLWISGTKDEEMLDEIDNEDGDDNEKRSNSKSTPKKPPSQWLSKLGITNLQMNAAEGTVSGEIVFSGDTLPWETGVYEIRYHHSGNYSVLCCSRAFEVKVESFTPLDERPASAEDELEEIQTTLARGVGRCVEAVGSIELDEMILEQGVFETVSPLIRSNVEEAVCRRIVYYIKQVFGVEFAWNVVVFLKTIRQLAVRIHDARIALAPFSSAGIRARSASRPGSSLD